MATLQDICLQITDGKHGDCENEKGSGYYFISCKDVKDGWVDYSGARQITEEDYLDTHRRTRLEPDDILITNSGTIGRMVLVPRASETSRTTFQKSVAILKPRQENVIPRWLYYCLMVRKVELIAWAGGTAQKNLLLRDLRAFEVATPSHPTQRKIASILSAYDDLIENNLRRIEILEEMAQLVYREWFVKFRFPGHENARFVGSPLGKIPDGWEIVMLKELVECRRDSTSAGRHLSDRFYVPIDCIPRRSLALLETKSWTEAQSSLQLFDRGDILFGAMRPYFHKVVVAPFKGVTRTTCFVLRPHSGDELAYSLMTLFREETIQFASAHTQGATIPYAVWDGSLGNMQIVRPSEPLVNEFSNVAGPMLRMIQDSFLKINSLREMRDLLLPKLISGELDVSELDIDIGEEPA